MVWDSVQVDIPPLREQLVKVLTDPGEVQIEGQDKSAIKAEQQLS
jgi:hypothetical protein